MTVLRIGAAPEVYEGRCLYFDGEEARPRQATLTVDEAGQALIISLEGVEVARWALEDIRRLRDQAGGDLLVLREKEDALARLVLSAEEDQRILTVRATSLNRPPPVPQKPRLVLWSAAAFGAVCAMIFVLIPFLADNLAGFIPQEGKRALGETVLEDVREALDRTGLAPVPFCEAPEGSEALAAMGERLFPEGLGEVTLSVFVLDHPMVNAFALPGGIVVFMRGLIERAENPDEVAAVYAHEVGHVVARDPSRIALRSAGSVGVLGLLLGDFAGGAVVLFLTNRLIQADYTQAAEDAADSFAHEVLFEAGIRPDAMAVFFERLRERYGDEPALVQQFSTHPALRDRIAAARAATPEDATYTAALDAASWGALREICGSDGPSSPSSLPEGKG